MTEKTQMVSTEMITGTDSFSMLTFMSENQFDKDTAITLNFYLILEKKSHIIGVNYVSLLVSAGFDESKSSLSWINFILISINIAVFLLITFICISLVKFMKRKH